MSTRPNTALDGCRVLDLTDQRGAFCGSILGSFGANVIKIEPPEGDNSRRIGPFYRNICDPEFSLYWFALNVNKRGITVNLKVEEGRDLFRALVKRSNIVVESFEVGHLDSLGLGYDSLKRIKPDLIMTTISAYGQEGPYSTYRTCDLVASAMSGLMYMTGDSSMPPVRISVPQAYLHAGAQAATATLVAYYYWQITGEGQLVDVSIHGAMTGTTLNAVPFWELQQRLLARSGPFRQGLSTKSSQRQIWRCKDGFVAFLLIGGVQGRKTNRRLVDWMTEEDMAPPFLRSMDWDTFNQATMTQDFVDQLEKPVADFFLSHSMSQLFEDGRKRRIMLAPVATPEKIVNCPHLKARSFWETLNHPKWQTSFSFPGAPAKLSASPCSLRRAPLIGEHNTEVYIKELGIGIAELEALKERQVV